MTKEFEALERLAMPDELHIEECKKAGVALTEDYDVIKQALLELKSIKEANLSEALKCLESIKDALWDDEFHYQSHSKLLDTIEQALLKAQEQEKENELLKEIIKSLFDRGCPLHQYIDKEGVLTIEVDDECSIMRLGEYKGVDLDAKLKEVLE